VGAGTEYALTNRISWRSEATYTRFSDQNFNLNINVPGNPVIGLNAQDEVWMVRTGLNFKF
jgi:opacity protein-like surface antigen